MSDALLIVDMVQDFVTGAIPCPRAKRIIPNIRRLAEAARAADVPVIYVNDAHLPKDFELKIWGPHSMAGSKGAQIIPELKAAKGDYVFGKQTYSAFYETPLDSVLRAHDVDGLVIVGLHSNICCRHTSADAFFRGIRPILPEDGVESLTQKAHEEGLEYIRTIYQGEIVDTRKVLQRWG
ncbi:MAG TPA: isochorismatase family cysteine hydrolase [Thermoplasmata archaeon]|nr:isochorismatase family cysteine hydrolase [Thermoplasmata archaeon]